MSRDPIRATYDDWRDFPLHLWRWPNFSPAELACNGTGALRIDPESLDKLQALRDRMGAPLVISSAYRSPLHDRRVGGAPASSACRRRRSTFALAAMTRTNWKPPR
ncbi:D-Ala-D-Ala carboxypeptidase family metallohydrolase (plasmid) [Rhodobacter capsulatus]|uniref:D-Ala-D-Ala carboxypeptidase family metallohydrolase n=1 Tax=Rhodobacter capsulatus TaxID=1061 RepID=UPI00402835A0